MTLLLAYYNKKKFGSEIRNFLSEICKKVTKSDLSSHGWKVHQPLIEETKNQSCYRFAGRFNICFTAP